MSINLPHLMWSALVAFVICGTLYNLRGLRMNNRTANDRRVMIEAIFTVQMGSAEFHRLLNAYNAVEYGDHFRAYMRWESPLRLYDPELIGCVRRHCENGLLETETK